MGDDRRRECRASVLMLMPAAVLIVLLLGSIAVDSSLVLLAHRDLESATAAAANDAVTYGLDERAYRETGEYRLDPARVEEAVALSLDARGLTGAVRAPRISIRGTTVAVSITEDVHYLFAPALPGIPRGTAVTATGVAEAVEIAGLSIDSVDQFHVMPVSFAP